MILKRCEKHQGLPDNRIMNLSEIERAQARLVSMPSLIFVEITTLCNLRCIMCRPDDASIPPFRQMDYDSYLSIAKILFPTALRVEICGMGEPLLHPELARMIELTETFNAVRLSLTTNGILLNGAMAEILSSRPVDVTVSIDGATPETYQMIRGQDKFQLVVENVAKFASRQHRQSSVPRGTTVVQLTLQRGNIEEFPRFVKLMAMIGVDCVSAHEVTSSFNRSLELPWQKYHVTRHLEEAIQIARDNHVKLLLPRHLAGPAVAGAAMPDMLGYQEFLNDPFIHPDLRRPLGDRLRVPREDNNGQSASPCFDPYQTVLIRADMELFVCCREKIYAGHFDEDNFDSVWNGPVYRSLRKTVNTLQCPEVCRRCARISRRSSPD